MTELRQVSIFVDNTHNYHSALANTFIFIPTAAVNGYITAECIFRILCSKDTSSQRANLSQISTYRSDQTDQISLPGR
jgi:hypothetical protein